MIILYVLHKPGTRFDMILLYSVEENVDLVWYFYLFCSANRGFEMFFLCVFALQEETWCFDKGFVCVFYNVVKPQ